MASSDNTVDSGGCAAPVGMRRVWHPHCFSKNSMEALTAILDTFMASLPPVHQGSGDELLCGNENKKPSDAVPKAEDSDLHAYYNLSASGAGTVDYAAGLICARLKPSQLLLARIVLWLLSTRIGTFLLFGFGTLCFRPPFFRKIAEIPTAQREKLLLNQWSLSPFPFLRKLFNAFKTFSVYPYFTMIDNNGRNPTWNAIGYCGPDPKAVEHRQTFQKTSLKPLENSVFDAEELHERLPSVLKQKLGFLELADFAHLEVLYKAKKEENMRRVGISCDAVVVGSGSGGGVAAAVLAKAGYKVLVLEKGKYYARDDLSLLEGQSMEEMYEGGGLKPTENSSTLMLAGSTVGGGTAVNWSASYRTPPHVLCDWEEDFGLSMFGPGGEYERAMDTVMARLGVEEAVSSEEENFQNKVLRCGCKLMDYKVSDVPRNGGAGHTCGWCGFGCWNGKKQATTETWLADAAVAGAAIVSGAAVDVVLRKGGRATGVVARVSHDLLLYVESRVTVLSGGALNTPLVLQRSGLKNRHIGKHLHLHPVQMVWGYFPEAKTPTYSGGIITAASTEFAQWGQRDAHGCILQTPSAHPGLFAVLAPWTSASDFKERMRRYSRTVLIFALVRDRDDSGTIHASRDGADIHYHLHPKDEAALLDGGAAALQVLISAGATEVGTLDRRGDRLLVRRGDGDTASPAEIDAFLQRVRSRGLSRLAAPLGSAHQMGSCRMGARPENSAVSPVGRTWEVDNLFVADASVLPTALGVNPMITVQSVAYCIAQEALKALRQ